MMQRQRIQKCEIHLRIASATNCDASATNYEGFNGLEESEILTLPSDVAIEDGVRGACQC